MDTFRIQIIETLFERDLQKERLCYPLNITKKTTQY